MLAEYTTLGVGGPAARFVEAESDDEVIAAVRDADAVGEPVLVLGGGSNLVVADEGFPGVVVHVATKGVRVTPGPGGGGAGGGGGADGGGAGGGAGGGGAGGGAGAAELTVAAGEDWDALVERCVAEGLSGVECLSGIPGLAGATPIQNVGAYGQEVAETVVSVRAYDRVRDAVVELANAECGFGYRTSAFKRSGAAARGPDRGGRAALDPASATGRFVVLGVTFRLARAPLSAPVRYRELARTLGAGEGDRVPLAEARAAVLTLRRGKGMVLDPGDPDTRSAGSFFTNPVIGQRQYDEVRRRAAARSGQPEAEVSVPHFPAPDGLVKVPAGWLIEHAGFAKGYPGHGSARISSKHTLALTNLGDATAASLIGLAREIRDGVRQAFGVDLVSEPVLIGAAL
ncbi:MAG TPA: UDP-N-acetylmuramate dehydrogenase [Streptosporangiaceae bacterium]|nr:UDP-N-acetylmuramate dehydrogenase [Streptosporangiaceae bacterium]